MTLTPEHRYTKMWRLIKDATGWDAPDGEIIYDSGVGMENEPEAVWVSGNWSTRPEWSPDFARRIELLGEALEGLGVEVLWYDEYIRCDRCQKLLRKVDDSAFWRPQFHVLDGNTVCRECILSDYAPLEFVRRNSRIPDTAGFLFDDAENWLRRHSWIKFGEDYQTGWHGRGDNPDDIVATIRQKYPDAPVAMVSEDHSTFQTAYNVYYLADRDDEIEVDESEGGVMDETMHDETAESNG